ncbi:MAG: hypothetical protein KAT65_26240 [Methanophagales archaeon]|nr:hypothetical protein [Methanophagales archaeon]
MKVKKITDNIKIAEEQESKINELKMEINELKEVNQRLIEKILDSKPPIIKTAIATAIALMIAFVSANALLTYLVIDNEPIYISNVDIYRQGANYTSAKWEFYVQPEQKYVWSDPKDVSWAFCDMDIRNIENCFNLSEYNGILFYISGNIENQPIEFNLFTHYFINDNRTHQVCRYSNKEDFLITTNWDIVNISFSNLSIVPPSMEEWYPKSPDLEKVFAIGFAVKTYTPIEGEIHIDEVSLIHKNGSSNLISNFDKLDISINGKDGVWHAGTGHL